MNAAYSRRKKYTLPEKPLRLTLDIARWVLVAITFAVLVFSVFTAAVFNREGRGFIGKNYFVISNNFMEPGIENGSVVLTEKAADYYPGDTIVFKSNAPEHYGEYTVRRVRDKIIHFDRAAYITYPNSSGMDDLYPAYAEDVVGKVTSCLEGLGSFYGFVKSPAGYFTLMLLPFMLLIAEEFVRYFLFSQKKAQAAVNSHTVRSYPESGSTAQTQRTSARTTASYSGTSQSRITRTPHQTSASDTQPKFDTGAFNTGKSESPAPDDQPTRMIKPVKPTVKSDDKSANDK